MGGGEGVVGLTRPNRPGMAELGMLKLNCAICLPEEAEPATLGTMRSVSQIVSRWACLQLILGLISPWVDKTTQHVRNGLSIEC